MQRLEVGLLECDTVEPHLAPIAGGYADMFADLAARAAPHLDLVRHRAVTDPLPAPDAHRAWLITGSRWSVYDDQPWIGRLLDHLRAVDAVGGSLVGICFGHQAIAHALGGEAARSERGWGLGVHRADVVRPQPWMDPPLPVTRLRMSHQDQVRSLPPGATVLARSAHCAVAMLAVGARHLGIQGHPEFGLPYATALLAEHPDRAPRPVLEAAQASLAEPADGEVVMGWIGRFLASGPCGRLDVGGTRAGVPARG